MRQSSTYSGEVVMTGAFEPFEELYFTARDGLKLHARRYPAADRRTAHGGLSCCLAGLTRNGRDFHELAMALSQDPEAARTSTRPLPRPRPVAIRPRLAQLRDPDRAAGRSRPHDPHRAARDVDDRHLARWPDHDVDGGSAADRDRRCRAERHRTRDRAEGPRRHHRVCRPDTAPRPWDEAARSSAT